MHQYLTKYKNSLSTKLLSIIFCIFLLVTLGVTLGQLTYEYYHEKKTIKHEIEQLPVTFGSGLERSVWTFSDELTRTILTGIYELPVVSGIKVQDNRGILIMAIGIILDEDNNYFYVDSQGKKTALKAGDKRRSLLFAYIFPLTHTDQNNDFYNLGSWTVYTSRSIILKRITHGMVLILVNFITITIALWLILRGVIKKILGIPLENFTRGIKKINLENLQDAAISLDCSSNDELKIMEKTFNTMIGSLYSSRQKLEQLNQNLENLVEERTARLKQANIQLENEITERELIEQALREAKEQSEAANQAKSVFLSSMSHELRTPLNAIFGFSQVLRRSTTLSDEDREYVNYILKSGEHLLSLINEVLTMNKIEAGYVKLNPAPFDLYCLLEEVENMFRIRTEERGVQLFFETTRTLPRTVLGDVQKIRQILINLLGNAVKFTPGGSIRVEIDGECIQSRWHLSFRVRDTGIGIAPEDVESIFEAFVQARQADPSQPGTGLGLPISRKFARLMGGDLTAASSGVPGEGSLFTFELDVEAVREKSESMRQENIIGLVQSQNPFRLLVVDDYEPARLVLKNLLHRVDREAETFQIMEAANGKEALKICETWGPHLILMDIRMPGMDGVEAVRKIRETGHSPRPVIIALTASSFEEDKETILKAGCDAYMGKPFYDQEIFSMLKKYLNVEYIYEKPPQVTAGKN